ncbi:DsbA family oxidoreductase [Leekyejoonella antrihumi]|uniref:DsbA family oxidoreductase n=1 Tax=Leekyejoonella antrihumi TaxID=1660198 RepID=UPI001C964370|nr:DsbA family protein [Leekyejoonella antrihumi]
MSPDRGVVTVWSDIGCPWASLGLHTLLSRARERDVDVLVDHRAFPLELFNKRATPKGIIDVEVTAIAGLVPALHWRQWIGSEAEYVVSTLPAMGAVQAAKDLGVGGLRASNELDSSLRRAFYERGRCISVHAEILKAASMCPSINLPALEHALEQGQGHATVFSDWHIADSPLVKGSPHFFLGDRYEAHNPGVDYHWTAPPGEGFVRFDHYDPTWADTLLDLVER